MPDALPFGELLPLSLLAEIESSEGLPAEVRRQVVALSAQIDPSTRIQLPRSGIECIVENVLETEAWCGKIAS